MDATAATDATTITRSALHSARKNRHNGAMERKPPPPGLEDSALLSKLLELAPIGICILDRELRYVHINTHLAATNGLPVAEHLGKRLPELLPWLVPDVVPDLEKVLREGHAVARPMTMVAFKGDRIFDTNYDPIFAPGDPLPAGVLCIVTEVTDRHHRDNLVLARAKEAAARAEVADALGGAVPLADALARVSASLQHLLDAEEVAIYTLEGAQLVRACGQHAPAVLDAGAGLANDLMRTRSPRDPGTLTQAPELAPVRAQGLTAVSAQALFAGAQPLGISLMLAHGPSDESSAARSLPRARCSRKALPASAPPRSWLVRATTWRSSCERSTRA
jgi:hypothetical protein